jgi:hypothetical protein
LIKSAGIREKGIVRRSFMRACVRACVRAAESKSAHRACLCQRLTNGLVLPLLVPCRKSFERVRRKARATERPIVGLRMYGSLMDRLSDRSHAPRKSVLILTPSKMVRICSRSGLYQPPSTAGRERYSGFARLSCLSRLRPVSRRSPGPEAMATIGTLRNVRTYTGKRCPPRDVSNSRRVPPCRSSRSLRFKTK